MKMQLLIVGVACLALVSGYVAHRLNVAGHRKLVITYICAITLILAPLLWAAAARLIVGNVQPGYDVFMMDVFLVALLSVCAFSTYMLIYAGSMFFAAIRMYKISTRS